MPKRPTSAFCQSVRTLAHRQAARVLACVLACSLGLGVCVPAAFADADPTAEAVQATASGANATEGMPAGGADGRASTPEATTTERGSGQDSPVVDAAVPDGAALQDGEGDVGTAVANETGEAGEDVLTAEPLEGSLVPDAPGAEGQPDAGSSAMGADDGGSTTHADAVVGDIVAAEPDDGQRSSAVSDAARQQEGDHSAIPSAASESASEPSSTSDATSSDGVSNAATAVSESDGAEELPTSYDARKQGLVSSVRLQDPWGACWAFAPLAAMEANLVKQGLLTADVHLSVRHLIYFAGIPAGAEAGAQAGEGQHPDSTLLSIFGDNAVFEMGGHALEVASAISSGSGVVLERDYPYQNDEGYLSASGSHYSSDGTWSLDESARKESVYTLVNMDRLPSTATFAEAGKMETYAMNYYALNAVKRAILEYGAVSASYCAYYGSSGSATYFDPENATFFNDATNRIDHDVCIVGWDDSVPRDRFTTGTDGALPEGDGAWIVKNSWGAASNAFPNRNDWGDDGYFYLSFFDRSVQGFTAWQMAKTSSESASIVDQHDYMGQRSNSETRVGDYNPVSYANVFTAGQDQEVQEVSVNTYAPGTEVNVRVYALDGTAAGSNIDPTSGTLLASKTATCAWSGYHRIRLDEFPCLKAGQRFAVVVSAVETDAQGNRIPVASIEAGNNEASMATYGLTHYDTVICNEGETSVFADADDDENTPNVWIDGTRFAQMISAIARDGAHYGNACIKVFSAPYRNSPSDEPTPDPAPAPTPTPSKEDDQIAPSGDSDNSLDPQPADQETQVQPADQAQPSAAVEQVRQTSSDRASDRVGQTQANGAPQASPGTLAATGDGDLSGLFLLVLLLVGSGVGSGVCATRAFRQRF